MSRVLSVTCVKCHVCKVSRVLSVTCVKCHVCKVSRVLSVTCVKCHVCKVSLVLSTPCVNFQAKTSQLHENFELNKDCTLFVRKSCVDPGFNKTVPFLRFTPVLILFRCHVFSE